MRDLEVKVPGPWSWQHTSVSSGGHKPPHRMSQLTLGNLCCIRVRPSWRGYHRCNSQLDRAGVRCSVKTGNVCEARGNDVPPLDSLGRVFIVEADLETTGCCNLRLWNAISPWLVSLLVCSTTRLEVTSHTMLCITSPYTNFGPTGPNYDSNSNLSDFHQRVRMPQRLDKLVSTT